MKVSLWGVFRICFLMVMSNIMNVLDEDRNVLIKSMNGTKMGDNNTLD